jgi:hypothetical protein
METTVKVMNRGKATVIYKVPEMGIRRVFQPNETKEIGEKELRQLSYLPGGRNILTDSLIIKDQDMVDEILGDVEPEYYYTTKELKELLLEGTLDELLDCLDFAPKGVLDNLKDICVELQINDLSKRKAIEEGLHFNINKAIEINEDTKADEKKAAPKTRRTKKDKQEAEVVEEPAKKRRVKTTKVEATVEE